MNIDIDLPNDYKPFVTLNLCSNIGTNYIVPIRAKNYAPLLIGQGEVPIIWIALANPNDPTKWNYLVRANKSFHPDVKVQIDKANSAVEVYAGAQALIKAKIEKADSAAVSHIDLRPIGLNIHGNETTLYVGNNQLSSNAFHNVTNLIGIGG